MTRLSASPRRLFQSDLAFSCAIAAAFLALTIPRVLVHVMWRDELRVWQLCLPCTSLGELRDATMFEGSPLLWYWIVWWLTRAFESAASMQVVHVLLSGAVVFVFARYAPFGRTCRALFALGYYPFFEYAIISRNYVLVFLFLLIGCAALCAERRSWPWLLVALLGLTQSSIWGCGFSALLLGVMWVWRAGASALSRVVLTLCTLGGMALAYWSARPGPSEYFIESWRDATVGERLAGTISAIWSGLIPLPALQRNYWNSNFLDGVPELHLALSLLLALMILASLLRRPIAFAVIAIGAGGLLGFMGLKFHGFNRHFGHLFMLLIASCWIAARCPTGSWLKKLPLFDLLDRQRAFGLAVLLALHALIGIGVAIADVRLPFSASQAAAQHITSNARDARIIGHLDFATSPLTYWLGRQIYFPVSNDLRWCNTQDDRKRDRLDGAQLLDRISQQRPALDKPAILVLNRPLRLGRDHHVQDLGNGFRIKLDRIATFTDSTVPTETYDLYRVVVEPSL